MRTEFTQALVARVASYFLIGGGALSAASLLLPQSPGVNSGVVALVSAAAMLIGLVALFLPWRRWPRRASLSLLPLAFALIAAGNYFGPANQQYTYSIFFVVAFTWIGIGHSRWTSVAFSPLAAVAYLAPIMLRAQPSPGALSSAFMTIPVSVLVGEFLAWMSAGERRSRETAHSLARVSLSLGRHLNASALAQNLVEEARSTLESQHAVLYQLDPETKEITSVFSAGVDEPTRITLDRLRGISYEHLPRFDTLSQGRPIVVEDVSGSPRDADLAQYNVKSYVAMPVMALGDLVGILWCSESSARRRYRPEDLSVASALAGQASAAFQNARLYEQTLKAARCDSLTGLGNRRAFHEHLDAEVSRARRHNHALTLLLLDTDTLKDVNDAWGHVAGDRVLRRLSAVLEQQARPGDVPYRIGGDEFALVLPETSVASGTILAERLRHRIVADHLGVGEDLTLTVSIGVASLPEQAINADELYERADTALYEVKHSGGNAVAIAPSRPSTGGPGVKFGVDIPRMIEEERLVAYYQPIFALDSGAVIGYEVFCRVDPALGNAPTQSLFRAAGALGLVEALDRTCRDVALRGAKGLAAHQCLFLNVAPAAVASPDFSPEQIIDAASAVGISRHQLVIELTELERPPSFTHLYATLEACRQAGLRLALDDFGAGGADLDLLSRIAFDFVKVDAGFVHDASSENGRVRLLSGLTMVAKQTGADVVAEGVESRNDLDMVRSLGFQAAQGFLLQRPTRTLEKAPLEGVLPARQTLRVAAS